MNALLPIGPPEKLYIYCVTHSLILSIIIVKIAGQMLDSNTPEQHIAVYLKMIQIQTNTLLALS